MRPAIFLDRDGVINENRPDHITRWDLVQFLPGVFDALRRLAASDYALVVVTNQSAVGRGLMTAQTLHEINDGIVARVRAEGGRIDALYACPHGPDEGCACRKPKPGMLLQAAEDLGIDLSRSYLVGDAVTDVEAALRAGCRPFLVRTGRGEAQMAMLHREDHATVVVVANLREAVVSILGETQTGPLPENWSGLR